MRIQNLGRMSAFSILLVLAACTPLAAQDERPFVPLQFTISAAAEPVPALRYHLLPPPENQIEGNAVPVYMRVAFEQSEEWWRDIHREPARFLEFSEQDFPVEEAGKLVARFDATLKQLSDAAVRSHADWAYVLEGRDPLTIPLPDSQSIRNFTRLLAVKARYETRSERYSQAIDSVRDGLALSRHVAAAPFLVNQLIGVAAAGVLLHQVDEFVQAPDAPNLYWALAELPRPFVVLRPGLGSESRLLTWRFPELAIPNATHDWEQLAKNMRNWAVEVARMEVGVKAAPAIAELANPPSPEKLTAARQDLSRISAFSAADVADMSDAELTVRYTVALHREISEAWRKWLYLPYPQSIPRFSILAEKLREDARRRELFPLVSLLSPIGGNLSITQLSIDRQIARLQLIEALRMHASQTGTLPAQLSDVTIEPVPLDPATGGPFAYKLEGEVATLDVTDLMGQSRDVLRMPVRLTLRK
jgi:hypothetical protein